MKEIFKDTLISMALSPRFDSESSVFAIIINLVAEIKYLSRDLHEQ